MATLNFAIAQSSMAFYPKIPVPLSFTFKKMGQPRPLLSLIFGLFKQTLLKNLRQIYMKNVHPVYGAGIQTHDLRNMSLLP